MENIDSSHSNHSSSRKRLKHLSGIYKRERIQQVMRVQDTPYGSEDDNFSNAISLDQSSQM